MRWSLLQRRRTIELACFLVDSLVTRTVWRSIEVVSLFFSSRIDEKALSKIGMCYQEVTSLRDLSEGMLLLNYPTEFVSRNPFDSVLTRDEILYITEIGELGVRGIILNPFVLSFYIMLRPNPVVRKETKDGHEITIITSRNPEPSRRVFVSPSSACSRCLDAHVLPLNESEVVSVTPDWEGMMETNLSTSVPIVQFDNMRSIPYPTTN